MTSCTARCKFLKQLTLVFNQWLMHPIQMVPQLLAENRNHPNNSSPTRICILQPMTEGSYASYRSPFVEWAIAGGLTSGPSKSMQMQLNQPNYVLLTMLQRIKNFRYSPVRKSINIRKMCTSNKIYERYVLQTRLDGTLRYGIVLGLIFTGMRTGAELIYLQHMKRGIKGHQFPGIAQCKM